ncbi:uncharacterized protein LOC122379139 [Amphibalanus amphitrite]|uniref:uncharacterized protein LOC122379139 n=1 Tax=Amphibalanus amphitrite TaxID=1232801 RepID=UPI001C9270C1|nr:uncharacterized protein LOC122379139 [Amphibalanus amphitrite]
MAVETGLLEAPSSVELLHVPKEITARIRLGTLIKTSLITEFPVNRFSPEARQLTTDEAAELLLSAGSPWRRYVWWSADVLPLLQRAVSEDQQVTHRYLLARLQSLSLPRQNISSLGEQMCALSHLSSCSLACNDLTEVQGHDLPRSLRSLQLYGNRLAAGLTALLTRCPPLEYLGLGRTQLTDDHLPELGALLSSNLPSLRVLDLSDNHICDLSRITELVTIASSIRSISLSGNPAFLASGYYQHFTSGLGRLLLLDGVLLTDELLADLQRQLEPAEEPEESASKKKKSGKKSPARKGSRRPTVQLDAVRFEPSLTGALVRVTGAVYLPFMPKDQYPGQELCVVFQWAGDRRCPSPFSPPSAQAGGPSSETDRSDGLCPLEALLQEKSDVTALDTPLEWHCTDLSALRNALLHCLHVEVFRREKWTPPKTSKKEKSKDTEKGKEHKDKKGDESKEKKGKAKEKEKNEKKNKSGESEGHTKAMEKGAKDGSAPPKKSAEGGADHPDGPPPEYSLGSVLLPVRALLRPAKQLLLQGTTSSGGTTAAVTETTWMEALVNIQEEKKERKASLKKSEKEEKGKNKRLSTSAKSTSSRKKEKPRDPVIRCFFTIELYRKPQPDSDVELVTYMPIDDLY